MNREKILSGNSRQYISITELDMLEQIEKLLPKYKSFNRLANDALRLGLPLLLEEKFNKEIKLDESDSVQVNNVLRIVEERFIPDNSLKNIVALLQEIVMNSNITKSLACSLFNEKAYEMKDGYLKEQFMKGGMRDTPDYMAKYEIDSLNAIDEVY